MGGQVVAHPEIVMIRERMSDLYYFNSPIPKWIKVSRYLNSHDRLSVLISGCDKEKSCYRATSVSHRALQKESNLMALCPGL